MFNLSNKNPRILVVGDLMIDHYVWGDCERISPEAPVQVVDVKNENNRLGGACNVIDNLVALNAKVSVCGVIGDDEAGVWLTKNLKVLNVDTSLLFIDKSRPTTKKTRILIGNQQVLRVDRESKQKVATKICQNITSKLESAIKSVDCVIISDYNKGLLNDALTQYIITKAKAAKKLILCDPKGKDFSKYKGATLLTPNKKEAQIATGIRITDEDSLIKAGMALKKQCKLDISLITLSEDGIGIFDNHKIHRIPTRAKAVYDVTGAGDTVIAALGFALSSGCNIYQSCEFANTAAAVVVGKVGSANATHSEILQYAYKEHSYECNIESKYVSKTMLLDILKGLRQSKIIFTNGCFDLLHRGHISYLNRARDLGDILIVGLNSDDSIKRLKGDLRPINSLENRAYMLCGLACVDYVVSFEEDTPLELIKAIKPTILVKGGDYANKIVVGSEYAKEVVLLDFVDGFSTSRLIASIRKET